MILLIDNYDSFTYNLYQQMMRISPHCQVLRNDKVDRHMIETMRPTAIVISPGPGCPDDAGYCLEMINTFADTIPMLGICLGHQALAQAFGGQVTHAQTIEHGKVSQVFHDDQGLFVNLPKPFAAGRYHSLHVEQATLPNCFHVDAKSQDGTIMGIRHQKLPLFGLQFHPESILTPIGDQLMQHFIHQYGRATC